jgi:hypothetical protein
MLTTDQVNERMSNKLEAKLFFAYKDLEEIELKIEGVIPALVDVDTLMKAQLSALNEIQVLTRIYELIENSIDLINKPLNK